MAAEARRATIKRRVDRIFKALDVAEPGMDPDEDRMLDLFACLYAAALMRLIVCGVAPAVEDVKAIVESLIEGLGLEPAAPPYRVMASGGDN